MIDDFGEVDATAKGNSKVLAARKAGANNRLKKKTERKKIQRVSR